MSEFVVLTKQLLNSGLLDTAFMLVKVFSGSKCRGGVYVGFVRGVMGMCMEGVRGGFGHGVGVVREWASMMQEVLNRLVLED